VSGCLDGTATVWSTLIRTHHPWATLKQDTGVWTMAFSPDGKWLATGTMDGTVQVWDWFGKQAVAGVLHRGLVTAVTFSPDGRWLATASMDDTARIRSWRPEDVVAEACARLPRNLTREEWQRYIGGEPYHSTCANLPIPEK
jgi:WD40 repeat protein